MIYRFRGMICRLSRMMGRFRGMISRPREAVHCHSLVVIHCRRFGAGIMIFSYGMVWVVARRRSRVCGITFYLSFKYWRTLTLLYTHEPAGQDSAVWLRRRGEVFLVRRLVPQGRCLVSGTNLLVRGSRCLVVKLRWNIRSCGSCDGYGRHRRHRKRVGMDIRNFSFRS